MPSSEFVEIDIADNNVAILDASCVLSSSHRADEASGKTGQVTQTQESEVVPTAVGDCIRGITKIRCNFDGYKGLGLNDTKSSLITSPPAIRKKSHKLDATPAGPKAKEAPTKRTSRAPTAPCPRGRKVATPEKCVFGDTKNAQTITALAATMSPTNSTLTVAIATPGEDEPYANRKNRSSSDGNFKLNGSRKKKTKSDTSSPTISESTKPVKNILSFFGPAKGGGAKVAPKSSDKEPKTIPTKSASKDTKKPIVLEVERPKIEVKADNKHKSMIDEKVPVAQVEGDVSIGGNLVIGAIPLKSKKEVATKASVKKAPGIREKKRSSVQTDNCTTVKKKSITVKAPTAMKSASNTAIISSPKNFNVPTEDSVLLSKLDGSPVEAVAFASRSRSAGRRKSRRNFYGSFSSNCSETVVISASNPACVVESDIKSAKHKAGAEEIQHVKVKYYVKKTEEGIDATSLNKMTVDDTVAGKSDKTMTMDTTLKSVEGVAKEKSKPKSEDANETHEQDPSNTSEVDDDATVDLEETPPEMKAAVEPTSDSTDVDDNDDVRENVPLEIEGMGCVLDVEDDMTHDSSEDMECESAKKTDKEETADENKKVADPSNDQGPKKTMKRELFQPTESQTAKKTVTPKVNSAVASSVKNHANVSTKLVEASENEKQVSIPKPAVLNAETPEKNQVKEASMITKPPKNDDEFESKTSTSVNALTICASESSMLSSEVCCRLQQLMMLREKYVTRAIELAARHSSEDFEEECLSLDGVKLGRAEVGEDGDVPDELLKVLLRIVQGSSLPLSSLANNAIEELAVFTKNPDRLSVESVSSKIKLLAQRKQYLSGHPQLLLRKAKAKLDCFENEDECFMWRWELATIDLLPPKEASKVKKARSLRRKLQSHHKSIINLISSIDKATSWLKNNPSATSKLLLSAPSLIKVSDMEEKVLKFEREEEKARLFVEAKKIIEEARQKQNELTEEERLMEKKRKEEEKERKKQEAAKEREEAKRNRLEEKEREKLRKRKEMEEKDMKQKARMMTFFAKPRQKKKQRVSDTSAKLSIPSRDFTPIFDSDRFRAAIGSQDAHLSNPFEKLSRRSRLARQRKTSKVNVSVFVTVLSDNPFSPQPYDDERVITVPNKYKFLGFHEDIRPPYHGTWSKPMSSTVTGRTPFGKDSEYLDYDIDSEAEWEDNDDDQGEDCDDDGADEEDEAQNEEEENDGWLAAEDDLGIEEDDDETKELRKKIHSEDKNLSLRSNRFQAAVISPSIGGTVHNIKDISSFVEGIDGNDAFEKLSSHIGFVLTPEVSISLDAFPPLDSNENEGPGPSENEISEDVLRVICQFIHNSNHNSREKLVTELRKAHPEATSSRAAAMRELDTIAEKKRLPNGGGVIWFVKPEYLNKVDLKEKDLKPPPDIQSSTPLPPKSISKAASSQKAAVVSPKPPHSDSPGKKRKQFVSSASANLFHKFLSKKQRTK